MSEEPAAYVTLTVPKPKRYRCSNGHEWEEPNNVSQVYAYTMSYKIGDYTFGPFCLSCLFGYLDSISGNIEEVTE